MSYQCPDIAKKTKTPLPSSLNQVGMSQIQTQIHLELLDQNKFMQMAEADAYVNLIQPDAKGIHMSRLFIKLQEILSSNTFNLNLTRKILEDFLKS